MVVETVVPSTPVPESETVCVVPSVVSVKESVPDRAPEVVGLKVMETVQLPPTAVSEKQVLVCEKSPVVRIFWMSGVVGVTVLTVTVALLVVEPPVPVQVIEYVAVTVGVTVTEPLVPEAPKPVPVHEVAPLEDQVSVVEAPLDMVEGFATNET